MEAKNQDQVQQRTFKQLQLQLEEKKTRTKELEDKLQSLEKNLLENQQTYLCVNRLWTQLNQDIIHLCQLTSPKTPATLPQPSPPASLAAITNPFLKKLLSADLSNGDVKVAVEEHKASLNSITEVETKLQERSQATKDALSSLLDLIHILQASRDELSKQNAQANTADAAFQQEHQRAVEEAAVLRKQLEGCIGINTALKERVQVLEDKLTEEEERVKKLVDDIADLEDRNRILNKRLNEKSQSGEGTGGNSSAPAHGALHAPDLEEEQVCSQRLVKRTAELEKEREKNVRLQKEVRDLQAKLSEEAWVPQTSSYKALQAQLTAIQEQLAARMREYEAACRERDEAQREATHRFHVHSELTNLRARYGQCEKARLDAESGRDAAQQARTEAEATLAREREKWRSGSLPQVLKLIEDLKTENALLKSHVQLHKDLFQRVESAESRVQAAKAQVQARDIDIQRLKDKLKDKDADISEGKRREALLKERVSDLKAFVDVLTTWCADPRELAEIRASEAALRAKVLELRQQLEGHELQAAVRDAEASERAARSQVDLAVLEADGLRNELLSAQATVEELRQLLSEKQKECEMYISEMENTGDSYEQILKTNVENMKEREAAQHHSSELAAEKAKLAVQVSMLSEQLAAAQAAAEQAKQDAVHQAAVKESIERELGRVSAEIPALREQLRAVNAQFQVATLEVTRNAEKLTGLEAALETSQRALTEARKQVDELTEKITEEKNKRKKYEDENKLLQTRLEKARTKAAPTTGDHESQLELSALRRLVHCNVCHHQQKDTVIVKCGHAFCGNCLNKSLTSRNRKCPGCQTLFSTADVKQLYLT